MTPDERRPAGPVTEGTGEPQPAGPAGEADAVEQDLDSLLTEAQTQRDEYLELAKRTKADFENFRKRMAVEMQAAQARGKIEVAAEVIEAVDNLERALEAAGAENEDSLASGVEMVLGGLRETLARNGVEAVDPKEEKFDPLWHEALSTQPVEGAEAGLVVDVIQKGYRIGEQLVRPARVVVSE